MSEKVLLILLTEKPEESGCSFTEVSTVLLERNEYDLIVPLINDNRTDPLSYSLMKWLIGDEQDPLFLKSPTPTNIEQLKDKIDQYPFLNTNIKGNKVYLVWEPLFEDNPQHISGDVDIVKKEINMGKLSEVYREDLILNDESRKLFEMNLNPRKAISFGIGKSFFHIEVADKLGDEYVDGERRVNIEAKIMIPIDFRGLHFGKGDIVNLLFIFSPSGDQVQFVEDFPNLLLPIMIV